MRILIVSQHFWPETFRINFLASELHAQGHAVEILCGVPNYPEGKVFPGYKIWSLRHDRHPDGYEIHRVPEYPRGKGGPFRLALNYLSYILSSTIIGPFLTRGRSYDIIFVYGTSPIFQCAVALIYRWSKRAKLAIWVQDLWPESVQSTGFVNNQLLIGLFGILAKAIYRSSDLILAQSRGFQEILRERVDGTVPVEFYPNPGERMPEVAHKCTDAEFPTSSFDIVFAGNMGTAQSLETILDAAQRIAGSDIRIVMVGSGSRSAWMQKQAQERGIENIHFAGRMPSHAMPGVYAQASALLITLSHSENYSITIPSKVQSYLAAGRPIVASLNGEGGQVIHESGAGMVVAAEDSEALANALLRMRNLSDDERWRMGSLGRRYHDKHFSIEVLARRLTDYFQRLVDRNERKGRSR